MSELAQALLEFQKNSPDLHRDATNPHFQSKFLSLEGLMGAVRPVANACGLVIAQYPTYIESPQGPVPALKTELIHAESGQTAAWTMLLMAEKDGPQAQGSALTYARRYSLMSALGLVADEDDDGNGASKRDPQDELVTASQDATKPSELPIHFGKNKGIGVGSLSKNQLTWYAQEWKVQDDPSDYDHKLKAAAIALLSGNDKPFDDVPFE